MMTWNAQGSYCLYLEKYLGKKKKVVGAIKIYFCLKKFIYKFNYLMRIIFLPTYKIFCLNIFASLKNEHTILLLKSRVNIF